MLEVFVDWKAKALRALLLALSKVLAMRRSQCCGLTRKVRKADILLVQLWALPHVCLHIAGLAGFGLSKSGLQKQTPKNLMTPFPFFF